jgi:hypothetical protein
LASRDAEKILKKLRKGSRANLSRLIDEIGEDFLWQRAGAESRLSAARRATTETDFHRIRRATNGRLWLILDEIDCRAIRRRNAECRRQERIGEEPEPPLVCEPAEDDPMPSRKAARWFSEKVSGPPPQNAKSPGNVTISEGSRREILLKKTHGNLTESPAQAPKSAFVAQGDFGAFPARTSLPQSDLGSTLSRDRVPPLRDGPRDARLCPLPDHRERQGVSNTWNRLNKAEGQIHYQVEAERRSPPAVPRPRPPKPRIETVWRAPEEPSAREAARQRTVVFAKKPKEPEGISLTAKALKVTCILDPAEVAAITVPNGQARFPIVIEIGDESYRAELNAKSLRRVVKAAGEGECTILVQGKLVGELIEEAGIAAQAKAPKTESGQ